MRFAIAALALAAVVASGAPALAQTPTSGTAQECAAVVKKAQDNPLLRIQQYAGEPNRSGINAFLQAAANAAANGDAARCWALLKHAKSY